MIKKRKKRKEKKVKQRKRGFLGSVNLLLSWLIELQRTNWAY